MIQNNDSLQPSPGVNHSAAANSADYRHRLAERYAFPCGRFNCGVCRSAGLRCDAFVSIRGQLFLHLTVVPTGQPRFRGPDEGMFGSRQAGARGSKQRHRSADQQSDKPAQLKRPQGNDTFQPTVPIVAEFAAAEWF